MTPLLRRALLAGAPLLAAVVAIVVLAGSGGHFAGACPSGTESRHNREVRIAAEMRAERSRGKESEAEREQEAAHPASAARCLLVAPESFADITAANRSIESRLTAPAQTAQRGAQARALRQKARLAASSVPGSGGKWSPLGQGPLLDNQPDFTEVGFGKTGLAGRVTDFAWNPRDKVVYASVASGGLWRTADSGKSWQAIGDALPTMQMGSVGWTPARGGTIIALTGDNAFAGGTFAGLGVYWSRDEGATWHKAGGVPDDALGFKVAVDPGHPEIVYAATGFGLFRSTDAGETFANVKLPTGPCAGVVASGDCYFANVVTDVVVRGADSFGHADGAVMAAVGYRGGTRLNFRGKPTAPYNGIYVSDTGTPASFTRIAPGTSGYALGEPIALPQDRVGRIELGIASGPGQNHNVVYAEIQDAFLFNHNGIKGLDVPEISDPVLGSNPLAKKTILNGVYSSVDFGRTWTLMSTGDTLDLPGKNSALFGVGTAIGYGPGIQAWYDETVAVDPTRQVGGIPTRLSFGVEEVWQNRLTTLPAVGPTDFTVIGRYFAGSTCQFGLIPGDTGCPTNTPSTPSTSTHPDQHAQIWIPDGQGGVTLFAGNDGGVFTQHVAAGEELDNTKWGAGANVGFHTLLPYDVAMAKDGVAYAGLQDNGFERIERDGRQIHARGGDGFFVAVRPDRSSVAYGEVTNGLMYRTTDGGHNDPLIDPFLREASFVTPFELDPLSPKHLLIAGRNVKETTDAESVSSATDDTATSGWNLVFDMGTLHHPGDANAAATADNPATPANEADPSNVASAVALLGTAAYVGYCGYCDPVTQGVPFASGIATNVGGSAPPKSGTTAGWHVAGARGLPERTVTGVAIDPSNPKTIYVSLGGYARYFAPPGSLGDDTSKLGSGHVFQSADAGESFHDVSGNLPNAPALDVLLRGKQLVVATSIGAFISSNLTGRSWAQLGSSLPNVPVFNVELKPGDPKTLVAATFGRGAYTYRFANPRACAATAGFRSVSVTRAGRGLRLGLRRRAAQRAHIDVLQASAGRRVVGLRLVRRFSSPRTVRWDGRDRHGRRVRDGVFVVRYRMRVGSALDTRLVTVERRHGRFLRRPDFSRRPTCDELRSFTLGRPVFGGTGSRALRGSVRVTRTARARVVVTGPHFRRTLLSRRVASGRTYRVALPAARLRRGDYRVSLTLTVGRKRIRSTLIARRI
ncbi:MAG: hypothetical protein QOI98_199 [Solirubrobacteraceae bacterium]|nr:hypothetical protein [Solirubrobacteraceae bacterium]